MSTLSKDILQLKRENTEKLNKLGVELEQFQKENSRKLDKIKSTLTQIQNEQEQQMSKLNEKLVEMKDEKAQKINLLTEEVNQMKKEMIKLKRVNDQLLEKLAIKFKKTENNQISELNKRVKRLEAFVDETRGLKHTSSLSQAEFPGLNEESKPSCKKTSEHETADEGCVVFSDMEDADSGQQDFNSSELLKELLAPSPQESKGSHENEDEMETVASDKSGEQLGTRSNKSRTTKQSKKQAKPVVIKKKRLSQNSIVKDECEKDGQEDSDSKIIDKSERLLDQQKKSSRQKKKRVRSVSRSSSDVEANKKQKGEETDDSELDQQQDSGKRKGKGKKKNSTARQKKGKDEGQKEEEESNLMEFLNDDSLSKKQKQKALLQSKNGLKCFRIKSSIDKKISYEDLTSFINAAKEILETGGMKTLLQEACVYAGSWHRVDYIKVMCEAAKHEAYLYDVIETAFIEMLAFHDIKYTKAQCEGWGLSGHGLDKKKYIIWNSTSCLQFLWQLLDDDQRDKVKEAIEEPTSRTKFGKLQKVLSDKLQLCTECCNSDQIKFIRGVDLETDSDVDVSSSSSPSRQTEKKTDNEDVPQVKTEKVDADAESDDKSDKEETDAHVNSEEADANSDHDAHEKDDDADEKDDDKDTDDSKSDE